MEYSTFLLRFNLNKISPDNLGPEKPFFFLRKEHSPSKPGWAHLQLVLLSCSSRSRLLFSSPRFAHRQWRPRRSRSPPAPPPPAARRRREPSPPSTPAAASPRTLSTSARPRAPPCAPPPRCAAPFPLGESSCRAPRLRRKVALLP